MEFHTSLTKENKELTWNIEDLVELFKTGAEPEIEFVMGETIGLPSKWKGKLSKTKTVTDPTSPPPSVAGGIDLRVWRIESYGTSAKIFGTFCSRIKNPIIDANQPYIFDGAGHTGEFKPSHWCGYENCLNLDTLERLKSSSSTPFTITIEIFITLYSNKLEIKTLSQQNINRQSQDTTLNNFGLLLQSGQNSDFVIRVKKTFDSSEYVEVKTHKAILAAQSTVFFAMLESQMQESHRDEMIIEDLTLEGLNVLLAFIYTGNIDKGWVLVWKEIVNAADKYNLPILLSFLDGQLYTVATNENAVELYKVAKRHGLEFTSKKMLEYIKSKVEEVLNEIP